MCICAWQVVEAAVGDVLPGGLLRAYLEHAAVAVLLGHTLFMHGRWHGMGTAFAQHGHGMCTACARHVHGTTRQPT